MNWTSCVAIAAASLLGACASNPEVSPALRATAEAWVRAEQRPLAVTPVAIWYANGFKEGMVCGEIEAPAALKSTQATLRYFYDPQGHGQIEMHRLWVTASPVSAALLETNRSLFDKLWSEHCRSYAPWNRRIAGWLG